MTTPGPGAAPALHITHFTDPTCPFAFSAEPLLRRLEWQLGDQATWETRLVGLIDSVEEAEGRGLTPQFFTDAYANFARDYGMPFSSAPRTKLYASMPACRAVVATRLHAPAREQRILRAFRVHHFAGLQVDEPAALEAAAADAGLEHADLVRWMAEPETEAALADDMDRSRHPSPAALAQDDRLADWPGGRRYTCPSLEFTRLRDGATLSAPGFQPWESYELAVANLLPELARRPAAPDVREVLQWAPFPLATVEVARLRGIESSVATTELTADATPSPGLPDAYWSA